MSINLPTIDKPVISSFSSAPPEGIGMGMEVDHVTVDVTLPPNKQAVWRVDRQHSFPGKGILKTTLLASLREKYGKETLTNVRQGRPATDDRQIGDLLWLFDEQGRPGTLPGPTEKNGPGLANTLTLSACINTISGGNLGAMEAVVNAPKGATNAQTEWCYASYTAVYVIVVQSDPPELYGQMHMVTGSLPFARRSMEATMNWKKEIAEGRHKQELENAKRQEKPKL